MLCIINNSIKHQSFVYTQLNDQKVLFQVIYLSISHFFAFSLNVKVNSSIWSIDRILSGANTPGQNGPGNKRVLRISHSSCITGASPSDWSISYPGHSWWSCSSVKKQSVHSIAPVDKVRLMRSWSNLYLLLSLDQSGIKLDIWGTMCKSKFLIKVCKPSSRTITPSIVFQLLSTYLSLVKYNIKTIRAPGENRTYKPADNYMTMWLLKLFTHLSLVWLKVKINGNLVRIELTMVCSYNSLTIISQSAQVFFLDTVGYKAKLHKTINGEGRISKTLTPVFSP